MKNETDLADDVVDRAWREALAKTGIMPIDWSRVNDYENAKKLFGLGYRAALQASQPLSREYVAASGTSHIIPRDPVTGEVDDAVEPVLPCELWIGHTRFGAGVKMNVVQDAITRHHNKAARAVLQASAPKIADDVVDRAFEIGFAWRGMLVGQTLEDSRAVGRTLGSDLFDGLAINLDGFDSFQSADAGIVEAKRRIRAALQASQPALTPADGTHDAYMRGFSNGRAEGLSLAERELHCAQESTDAAISDYNDALARIKELERVRRFHLQERLQADLRLQRADERIATLETALRRIRANPAGADIVAQYALAQQQEGQ